MKLHKINERFYYYPYTELTDRPNLYYLKGDDYSIAIDAGNSCRHIQEFYNALNDNNLPLPKYTIISHWHWDHTFGLKAISGKSISSRYTFNKLEEMKKWKWNIEDMKQREIDKLDIPFCNKHILLEYPDLNEIEVVSTDIQIDEKLVLDLGNYKVEIIPEVSTHCLGGLYVYIPVDKALIVQDLDCEDFYNDNIYNQDVLKKMISFYESLDYIDHYLGHANKESKDFALDRLRKEMVE